MRTAGLVLLAALLAALIYGFSGESLELPKYDSKKLQMPKTRLEANDLCNYDKWAPLAKPKAYDRTAQALRDALAKGDWTKATVCARLIRDMIPAKTPDEYPWSHDSRGQADAAIGELLLVQANYDEAQKIFEKVLAQSPKHRQASARSTASFGLAEIYAHEFKMAESQSQAKAAQGEYWSGCGTCEESQEMFLHVMNLVYTAASKPSGEAVNELLSVINGSFKRYGSNLTGKGGEQAQKQAAEVAGSFYLGLVYERSGETANAKKAFEFCVAKTNGYGGGYEEGLYAWQRLQRIKKGE